MKRCSQCHREIADSATTCGQCDSLGTLELPIETISANAPGAPIQTAAAAPAAPAVTAAKAGAAGNRKMLLAGLLVVAGGTLTFAMFRSAAAPATPINSSTTATSLASKTAAPKPGATSATSASPGTAVVATV